MILINFRFFHSGIVRHSIARVIAAIANLELEMKTWPDLLPFIHKSCISSTADHRATGIYILFTILEYSTEGFAEHLASVYELCGGLLNDLESLEVQVTAVRTLGTLAQYVESNEKDQVVRLFKIIYFITSHLMASHRGPSKGFSQASSV
jgi:hypothetical protein